MIYLINSWSELILYPLNRSASRSVFISPLASSGWISCLTCTLNSVTKFLTVEMYVFRLDNFFLLEFEVAFVSMCLLHRFFLISMGLVSYLKQCFHFSIYWLVLSLPWLYSSWCIHTSSLSLGCVNFIVLRKSPRSTSRGWI